MRITLLGAAAVAAACSSTPASSTSSSSDDGGAGSDANTATVTGQVQGQAPVTQSFQGNDYGRQGGGVQCTLGTDIVGMQTFTLDADQGSGNSELRVQYYEFDPSQLERDEDFTPTPPRVTTFELYTTIRSGSSYFGFAEPGSWTGLLSDNPTCHTSFDHVDTTAAGTLTCHNLLSSPSATPEDVTVSFSCAVMTL
jgi:hypothetical protein